MSDYTKIQNWASLTGTAVAGAPFDTEFAAIAASSATKPNKIIPAAIGNLATLDSVGDLTDSGVLAAAVALAITKVYAVADVKISAVESEPTGWLYCDGGSHSTSTYADLFAAIGYTYGGSGSSFSVPDFRGRSPAGLDNLGGSSASVNTASAADDMGGEDGVESVQLSSSTMPSHSHTATTYSGGSHFHEIGYLDSTRGGGGNSTIQSYPIGASGTWDTSTDGSHSHTTTISNSGSSGYHENVSPTTFTNFLIKT